MRRWQDYDWGRPVDTTGALTTLPAVDARLLAITGKFTLPAEIATIEPLGSGNVNDTWKVRLRSSGQEEGSLVLQRLNTRVFPRPDLVMANIRRLAEHLERPGGTAAVSGRWEMPRVLTVRDSDAAWLDHEGDCWRLLTYISGSRSHDTITGNDQAREVGRALGTFHTLIHDLPAGELADTLVGFHVTPAYLASFDRVLRRTDVPLTPQAQHCIAFIRDRESFMPVLEQAREAGRLRLRPIHGDPKVNNILFDAASGKAIALIDLDTVKPGLIHYDIGDCLRSCCNPLGEETEDWRAVRFDLELCAAVLEGYVSVAHRFLSDADYDHIPDAIRLLSLELGLRFFTDHLAGDVYFRTNRPRHNLQRALVQFRLTESIEVQQQAIRGLVERLRRQAAPRP
ncbi:MAG: phosphotransferase enzyme family protein [Cyanobium sp.]